MIKSDIDTTTLRCLRPELAACKNRNPYCFAHRLVNSIFILNSVQKFCCNGFSKFLLLYVILGPSSLWESYWCRPPLMSPAGPVHVRAPGKALISWEKSWIWKTHPQTKTIWHPWNALHEQIWKHQQFHYNIWEWSFQWSRSSWEIIKCDYTPYT